MYEKFMIDNGERRIEISEKEWEIMQLIIRMIKRVEDKVDALKPTEISEGE